MHFSRPSKCCRTKECQTEPFETITFVQPYIQIRKGASGHDVTFIHPKGDERNPISGEGVLIELVQAPKNVIDAYTERD